MAVRQNPRLFRSLVNGKLTRRSAKSICFCSSGGFPFLSCLLFIHVPIAHLFVTFSERGLRQTTASSQVCLPGETTSSGAACSGWHSVGVYVSKPQIESSRNYMKNSSVCTKKSWRRKSHGESDLGAQSKSLKGWIFGGEEAGCASSAPFANQINFRYVIVVSW